MTFARANLLRTRYKETGVMDFGLYLARYVAVAVIADRTAYGEWYRPLSGIAVDYLFTVSN